MKRTRSCGTPRKASPTAAKLNALRTPPVVTPCSPMGSSSDGSMARNWSTIDDQPPAAAMPTIGSTSSAANIRMPWTRSV